MAWLLTQSDKQGTATLKYEIVPDWDWSSCFAFSSEFALEGKIDVDEFIRVQLIFTPDQMVEYETEIQIKTQLETKRIRARGQGAEYKILASGLPNNINFAQVLVGDAEQKKVNTIRNRRSWDSH